MQAEAEAAPSSTVRNRLLAPTLSDLLDERKAVKSAKELQVLANKYAIDVEKLENVAQFVNSPSVEEGSHQKEISAEGEEIITMTATWINRSVSHRVLGSPTR